ncbi:MAG TPA: hypothetical protein PL070_21405 [Flavobacteriales bacterium]|nr:hypothetical protein [Flavobacteriales bacterium]
MDIALTDGGDVQAMYDIAVRNGITKLPNLLTPGHELVSDGSQLDANVVKFYAERAWKPITGKIIPEPYVCTGDQITVALPDGGTVLMYLNGASYVTFGRPDDGVLIFPSSSNVIEVYLEPGNYCLWPSDATGEPYGDIETWIINSGDTLIAGGNLVRFFYFTPFMFNGRVVDFSQGNEGQYAIWLVAPNCEEVLVPAGIQFFDFILVGAKLSQDSVDRICNALSLVISIGNACIIDGGTSASPSDDSAAHRAEYIALGGSIITN